MLEKNVENVEDVEIFGNFDQVVWKIVVIEVRTCK